MVTVETSAHVGPDGILRVETPVGLRDQDVRVVLVVQEEPSGTSAGARPAAGNSLEERLKAAGLYSGPKGPWNPVPYEPPELPGPPISETLVNDRR
jgi:hypothetical protein